VKYTLVKSMDTGVLYTSPMLWNSPADALRAFPTEFNPIWSTEAYRKWGDMVPQYPGEYSIVEEEQNGIQ